MNIIQIKLREPVAHSHDHDHGHSHSHSDQIGINVILGIFIFYIIDLLISVSTTRASSKENRQEKNDHSVNSGAALTGLIADFTHNFTDGVAISISFMISRRLGISTTISMVIHELSHELSDLSILIKSGYSYTDAMKFQLVTAFGGILGCTSMMIFGELPDHIKLAMVCISSGGFLYLVMANLMPELKREIKTMHHLLLACFTFLLGVMVTMMA